jgi:predicted transposase/invertase (TIGR01784 family)
MDRKKNEYERSERLDNARKEGLEQGLEQGLLKTACNALAKGYPIEEIHEITGLDIETIKDLQKRAP